jgi:hypothetical protein
MIEYFRETESSYDISTEHIGGCLWSHLASIRIDHSGLVHVRTVRILSLHCANDVIIFSNHTVQESSVIFFALFFSNFWILDFGFWILDFGFWILDFGLWILDFGFWILDFWIFEFLNF